MAFRRRSFTSRTALQHSLEAFMQSYNHERPHQGYRVRGRTPAALFWAPRGDDLIPHSGVSTVSTPLRVWTD